MKKALHQSRNALIAALTIALVSSFAVNTVQAKEKTNQHEHPVTKVSLNNASVEQLETLKGVGHKKAQAIVKYRQQIGQFVKIEQLVNVKGIGDKIIQDNKSRLTI